MTPASNSLTAPRDSQTLRLADGRTLGFAEYGSPTGKPIFFFHGFPSSRLEAGGILKLANREDIRIIAPDRPGFGLSTFNPVHRITDWPDDVRALAAHLGLNRFAILGGSGGGPYALACARALPAEMLSAVGLLAPAGPWKEAGIAGVPRSSRIVALMAYYWPASLRAVSAAVIGLCHLLLRTIRWSETMMAGENHPPASRSASSSTSASISSQSPTSSSPTTKPAHKNPIPGALLRLFFESFRQGTAPMVREAQLLTWEGWGFPLHEVRYDKVVIWHGVEDAQSPIRMVRYLARQLPHCELREFEGETHFTLAAKQLGPVLEELVPMDRDPDRSMEREGAEGGEGMRRWMRERYRNT
ncbi:Alpha/Beta hydrolase protein [Xylaria sp. FL1042]|nr:Alpha/Beta hydrolase protein [Xylaria sp. FL1042]